MGAARPRRHVRGLHHGAGRGGQRPAACCSSTTRASAPCAATASSRSPRSSSRPAWSRRARVLSPSASTRRRGSSWRTPRTRAGGCGAWPSRTCRPSSTARRRGPPAGHRRDRLRHRLRRARTTPSARRATSGLSLTPSQHDRLIEVGRLVKTGRAGSRWPSTTRSRLTSGSCTASSSPARRQSEGHHSRHVCIFAEGEVDRSPTGTGVSGRAALLHDAGQLPDGETIVIESILGTCFGVTVVGRSEVAALSGGDPRGLRRGVPDRHQHVLRRIRETRWAMASSSAEMDAPAPHHAIDPSLCSPVVSSLYTMRMPRLSEPVG